MSKHSPRSGGSPHGKFPKLRPLDVRETPLLKAEITLSKQKVVSMHLSFMHQSIGDGPSTGGLKRCKVLQLGGKHDNWVGNCPLAYILKKALL